MSEELPTDSVNEKPRDLNAIRDALVDAAGISIGLWVSYLAVLTYMLVAVASVTHNDLFFETSVKLPVLGVDLPSAGFFSVGPLLFLGVHAYVLLHFVLLAQKVSAFDDALRQQVGDAERRARLREQLPINIFVQFLAGPAHVRDGFVGCLLWLIALVSLVLAPVALMVFFQMQFLPYQHVGITWWHRILAGMEIALVCSLWPRIGWRARPVGKMGWSQRAVTIGVIALVLVVPVPILLFFSIIPQEALDLGQVTIQDFGKEENKADPKPTGIYAYTGGGTFNYYSDTRRPPGLWQNRSMVSGISILDRTKINNEVKLMEELKEAKNNRTNMETFSLRGRYLYQAILVDAKLPGVSLAEADLTRAVLVFADLRFADLSRAQLNAAILRHANLQHASLAKGKLIGANLKQACVADVDLTDAVLTNADLTEADLTDSNLNGVDFKGANLTRANLSGADLSHAMHLEKDQLNPTTSQSSPLEDQAMRACGNAKTKLPEGFPPIALCPTSWGYGDRKDAPCGDLARMVDRQAGKL